jgi:tRNA (cytidine/uridine-2'-O-)-methyltransferase
MTVFYNSWLSGEFQLPILSGLGYALGMLNVVLVNPEIPHNTGAAGRLCLATGARLHLIKPLGFSIDDRQVKRAGLDYWKDVDLCLWDDWEAFIASIELDAGVYLLTTKTNQSYWDVEFKDGDYIVFGPETRGLPESMLQQYAEQCLTIPMQENSTRSLNLATTVGIVLYEAVRQTALKL